MDDPWGSPWALPESTAKNDPPTPSPPKNLLSPPPRAFFGSTSNLQPPSPWATEDSPRDWTGAEQTDIAVNAIDWGVWAEPSSLVSQSSPRPDDFGKRSSIALPSSAATSPGLRPLPRSRTSSVYRHHSPDPWATEVSLHDRKDDPSTPVNALGIGDVDSQHGLGKSPILAAQKQDIADRQGKGGDDARLKEESEQILASEKQAWELPSPAPSAQKRQDSGFGSVPKLDIQDTLSRPPSTLSLNSSNGVDHQDSPITSIDEDTRSRLQSTSRRASSKVQELVGMYDGLATTYTEELSASARLEPPRESGGRSPSQTRSIGGDTDFGDFEDARSEDERLLLSSKPPSVTPRRSSTSAPQLEEAHIEDHINKSTERETTSAKTASAPVQQIIDKFGPIQFDVDFQLVDKLFPDISQDSKEDEGIKENSNISDQIIRDSFTTISERKTWYRLSRFGSMRKHDLGDDDNYYRVEWPTCRLHDDVIKIVRRWMEEDSISGRVTLGAGIRTSAFNWDSSAAPVDLGEVFARKAPTTHSRNTSLPTPNNGLKQPTHSTNSNYDSQPIQSPIKPPDAAPKARPASIPSFNWSSDAKPSPITHSFPSGGDYVGPKRQAIPTATLTKSAIHTTNQAPLQSDQSEINEEDEDQDEEDDWGEMVSSPRVESHPGSAFMMQSMNNANNAPLAPTSNDNNTSMVDTKSEIMAHSHGSVSISTPASAPTAQFFDQQTPSTMVTPKLDVWSAADLSIFEAIPTQTSKSSKRDTWPLADFSISKPTALGSTRGLTNPPKSKPKLSLDSHDSTIRAVVDEAKRARPPFKAVLGPLENKADKQYQDDIVESIVQSLPNLSYMLR